MQVYVTTDKILAEISANWPCSAFFPHNPKHYRLGERGFVQRDEPGKDSEILARFILTYGDPCGTHLEQWEPVEITPFARAAVARQRGYIGPVWL